jgi:hypothetical protein
MSKREPWDFWVLEALKGGKPAHLKDIYAAIEALKGEGYINPQLYGVDGRWGDDRPDYTHVVRSTMSDLKKRGMVDRLGKGKRTGVYCITDAGAKYLEEIEP